MLRRLFTAFLATVMSLSLCTAVTATENETPEKVNLYEKWGDFEDEQYWEGVRYKFFSEGSLERNAADVGAAGTNHSFFFDQHTGTWKDLRVATNLVAGETYDVSLYMKTDTPEITSVSFIIAYVEGEYVQSDAQTIGSDWTKITYSITMPEGKSTNRITFRFNNGQTDYKVYLDELCVIPRGDVPGADYSKIDVGLFGVETDDGVEVTLPAEYCDVVFSDIGEHWAEETIKTLAKYGYVNGVSPFEFAPDSNVTRAQFIKMIADLYEIEDKSYDGRFADVTEDQWFAKILVAADEKGLIPETMKQEGKINPDTAITREEAAVIAAKAAKDRGAKNSSSASFTDSDDVSDWAKSSVSDAASLGIINGYEDGKFLPKASITRAEAAQILMRVTEVTTRFNIYVDSQKGNDKNDGSENAPLASIEAARDMAKRYAPEMKNDIKICIRGEQYLEETFKLDETNSGQNGYKIIYTSWGDEKATLTMAKKFKGFQLHDVDKNIWKTYVGKGTFARQVYFNDVRGVRSRTVGYLKNADYIYGSHYLCDNSELLYLKRPSEVEGVFNNRWMQFQYKVSKISKENDRVRIDFNDYFIDYHNYLKVYDGDKNLIRQTPSFLENAYEFLDCGGEWYLNKHDGYLYYIPRDGEDMQTMECKIPIGEQLVEVAGSSYFTPVSHIAFDNLVMEGTDWKRIDEVGGYCPIQNNVYNDMAVGVQDKGAVHFDAARYIDFTNCDIRHTGQASAALMFWRGCKNVNVVGNEIYQTAGAGFMIDALSENVDRGGYSPQDRDPKEYTENFYIANNYIHSNAWVYHGGAQVGLGHPRHVVFTHNEVANAPYSGLHIGWGWGSLFDTGSVMYDVEISYNYIHDVMMGRVSDGAAIYTLGASSLECDKTNIEKNNVIKNNYLANGWKCDYIYPDMGSTSWYITKNVANRGYINEHEYDYVEAPAARNLQFWAHMHSSTIHWITFEENYATDDFAWDRGLMNMRESVIDPVHITEDHNNMEAWPEAAQQIMAEAGIEKEYRDNFKLNGPKIFNTNNRRQTIPLETPTDSGMMILGDNNTKYDLADFDIDWWCEDPEALTIDKNGMMTAHKKGTFEVEAMAFVDGMWQQTHFMIECGNEVESVALSHEKLNLINGFGVDVTALAKMTFGNGGDITAESTIEVKSNDTSVATAEVVNTGTNIRVEAVGEGETTISVGVTYRGKRFDIELPVKIISYNSNEGKDLPYSEIDMNTGWKIEGIRQPDGGMLVYGSPNHYMIKRVDGLLAFDMSVNPGSGWPSIAFADSDTMGNYATNDCYMIGFKPDHIEFQRWNKGERTMIFGNSQLPISGPGIPNTGDSAIFGYNERVSVVAGAIKEDEGTRIILNINGENIIDYMDTGAKALPSSGYFVVYNPAPGGMTFYPYSGITK